MKQVEKIAKDETKEYLTFRFGDGQTGNGILESGWGEPEQGFVWSEGKYANLTIEGVSGPATVSLSLWGYVNSTVPVQDVLVFANGLLAGYFGISDKTVIKFDLPADGASETLKLAFYIPNAKSPQSVEGGNDLRVLGLAMSLVQIKWN